MVHRLNEITLFLYNTISLFIFFYWNSKKLRFNTFFKKSFRNEEISVKSHSKETPFLC